jgi:O-antigen ligase
VKNFSKSNRGSIIEYLIWFGFFCILGFSVFNEGGIDILSHLLFAGSLSAFGILYWMRKGKEKNPGDVDARLRFGPEVFALGAFIIFYLISYLFSQTKNVGLFEVILFVCSAFIYIFVSSQKWDLKKFEKFLIGIIVVLAMTSLYGYWQYIFEPFNRFAGSFGSNIYKFSQYPNAYANFVIAALPVAFYFWYKKMNTWMKTGLGALIVIVLTSFFLSYSRGGLIVLSLMGAAYVIGIILQNVQGRKWRDVIKTTMKKTWLLILMIVISATLTMPVNYLRSLNHDDVNSFTQKVTLNADEASVSTSSRIEFWKGSVKLFFDNPILGTGPASFRYVYPKYQASLLENSSHPHNLFLKILVENGFFAMFVFVLFLGGLFARSAKVYKKLDQGEKAVFSVLIFSTLGSGLHNMIDYNLNFVSTIFLLFLFLGMISFFTNQKGVKSKNVVDVKKENIVKITLGIVAAVMLFVASHEVYYSLVFKQARAFHKNEQFDEAIAKYDQAQAIFLKRDLYISYGQVYNEVYEENGDLAALDRAEETLLIGYELNEYDAFLANFLGDVNFEQGDVKEARDYFEDAWRIDSKNNLDYMYDLIASDEALEFTDIIVVMSLLDEYQRQLANNAHLTILSGNPDAAIMLYEALIDEIYESEDAALYNFYYNELKAGMELMKETEADEKRKIEEKYGFELKKED